MKAKTTDRADLAAVMVKLLTATVTKEREQAIVETLEYLATVIAFRVKEDPYVVVFDSSQTAPEIFEVLRGMFPTRFFQEIRDLGKPDEPTQFSEGKA